MAMPTIYDFDFIVDFGKTMESYQAYKIFCGMAKGPVDEEDFSKMLLEEADEVQEAYSGRVGKRKKNYSSCIAEANDRMQDWYNQAYETARIDNLPYFIANHRRAYVWTVFLRFSHEPEFKTAVWLMSKMT